MSLPRTPISLSEEAFQDLKRITQEECGDTMSDDEIREMGVRLLRLFDLVTPRVSEEEMNPGWIDVSDREFKALKYLHCAVYHDRQSPSVRDVSAATALRSSRSGFRLVNKLAERGFVYRDEKGNIQLTEKAGDCDTKFKTTAESVAHSLH